MLIPLGILASAGGVPPIVSDYELISTSLVANNLSTQVQFTSSGVWSDYKHLQLRIVGRQYWVSGSPDGANLKITLNNTGTTYRTHFLRGAGTNVSSGDQSGVANFNRTPVSTSTSSNEFGSMVIDILDINSTTKNKTMRSLGGMVFSYGNWIELASAARFETNAITSLEVIANAGTLGSGTRVSLYGIKG
jgi:hypothetical protein